MNNDNSVFERRARVGIIGLTIRAGLDQADPTSEKLPFIVFTDTENRVKNLGRSIRFFMDAKDFPVTEDESDGDAFHVYNRKYMIKLIKDKEEVFKKYPKCIQQLMADYDPERGV